MKKKNFRVKVYDNASDPLWGELRIKAKDEDHAEDIADRYIRLLVKQDQTSIDLETMKFIVHQI